MPNENTTITSVEETYLLNYITELQFLIEFL